MDRVSFIRIRQSQPGGENSSKDQEEKYDRADQDLQVDMTLEGNIIVHATALPAGQLPRTEYL